MGIYSDCLDYKGRFDFSKFSCLLLVIVNQRAEIQKSQPKLSRVLSLSIKTLTAAENQIPVLFMAVASFFPLTYIPSHALYLLLYFIFPVSSPAITSLPSLDCMAYQHPNSLHPLPLTPVPVKILTLNLSHKSPP